MSSRKRYHLTLEDESRLELIKEVRFSRSGLILSCMAAFLAAMALCFLIVAYTPVRKLLPGYLREAERDSALECVMRVDSMSRALSRERFYLDNLLTVLDTDRTPKDSTGLIANLHPMTTDSLLGPSSAEQRFRAEMEEKEKYNISVLTPLAAEGMVFSPVSEEAVITAQSSKSPVAQIQLSRGNPVCSIADGTVLDVHYDTRSRGYRILIQHPRGFVSRYSRLANPLVDVGDHLNAGQIISLQTDGRGSSPSTITLEMWRDGDSMIPAQFLQ